jgi:hypothetical protein
VRCTIDDDVLESHAGKSTESEELQRRTESVDEQEPEHDSAGDEEQP